MMIALAVDKNNKGCQFAVRWACDKKMISRGQTIRLIHVRQDASPVLPPYGSNDLSIRRQPDDEAMRVFLPYRCFCQLKQVECELVVLQHPDVAKALVEYVTIHGIVNLLLGGPQRLRFSRLFWTSNIQKSVTKLTPKFCNVYVISKEKMSRARTAVCRAPAPPVVEAEPSILNGVAGLSISAPSIPRRISASNNHIWHDELLLMEIQHSFVNSSGRSSTESTFVSFYNNLAKLELTQGLSIQPVGPVQSKFEAIDIRSLRQLATSSDSRVRDRASKILQNMEDKEDTKRMLEQKLNQTMDRYHAARRKVALAKCRRRERSQS